MKIFSSFNDVFASQKGLVNSSARDTSIYRSDELDSVDNPENEFVNISSLFNYLKEHHTTKYEKVGLVFLELCETYGKLEQALEWIDKRDSKDPTYDSVDEWLANTVCGGAGKSYGYWAALKNLGILKDKEDTDEKVIKTIKDMDKIMRS